MPVRMWMIESSGDQPVRPRLGCEFVRARSEHITDEDSDAHGEFLSKSELSKQQPAQSRTEDVEAPILCHIINGTQKKLLEILLGKSTQPFQTDS